MTTKRAKELECQLAISQSTNVLTQIVLAKAGYKEYKDFPCKEIRVNGKQVLDLSKMGDSTNFKIMLKDLRV